MGVGSDIGLAVRDPSWSGGKNDLLENHPEAPQLRVEQIAQRPHAVPGTWWVTWRIRNLGQEPLQLVDSYVPHGKFRGDRVKLSRAKQLAPGTALEILLPVCFKEPPGTVVENTFLILTAVWQETPWRILVRMTVETDSAGAPMARTELITTQKVGFSDR